LFYEVRYLLFNIGLDHVDSLAVLVALTIEDLLCCIADKFSPRASGLAYFDHLIPLP
jgi:hypothetical protein